MGNEEVLLLVAVLTLIFSALTFFKPVFKGIWSHWLRFWWYRAMVALREDRSHRKRDLPEGVKRALQLMLHPVRRWHTKTGVYEERIRKFAVCPFYRPHHCVQPSDYGELGLGCDPSGACSSLGVSLDPALDDRQKQILQLVRRRPHTERAQEFVRTNRPCEGSDHISISMKVRGEWVPPPFDADLRFHMDDDRWLCPSCFGIPSYVLLWLPKNR